jgi:hypothetical protein
VTICTGVAIVYARLGEGGSRATRMSTSFKSRLRLRIKRITPPRPPYEDDDGDTDMAAVSYREATTGKVEGDRKPSPPRQLMGERRHTSGKRSMSA